MIGIKPLGDRVVIKKLEAEEKTQGGIILTSSAKEQPQVAEVVAVGPGTKDEPMEVKVGEKVDVFLYRIFVTSGNKAYILENKTLSENSVFI